MERLRGLLIQQHDHAVFIALVEQFRGLDDTLAGAAALLFVNGDSHGGWFF